MPEAPSSRKITTWRVIRYFLFILLYAGAEVALTRIEFLQQLGERAHEDFTVPLALAMGVTLVLMITILIGGLNFTGFTEPWRTQLFGIFGFLWSIDTAGAIGSVLARTFSPDSENGGLSFLYFMLGVVALLPFEIVAFRAYAKRRGTPI